MPSPDASQVAPFSGAKLALFVGDALVVILRDDKPDIPWPGHWDLPGGGSEPGETPLDCVLRETHEEIGLALSPAEVSWGTVYDRPQGPVWFFAAHLPAARATEIVLGDEGQEWRLMSPEDYIAHPLAIPNFVKRLRDYLNR